MKEIMSCLPKRLIAELESLKISFSELSELRLRLERPASLTVMGENIVLSTRVDRAELSECVSRFCRGSVYAHGDTICEGYISYIGGVRIGVCGSCSGGKNVGEISSLNIRIPHMIVGVSEPIVRSCFKNKELSSILIYSEPGIGKTTLLRDLAAHIGGELKKRVAVIDTRGELYLHEMLADTLCDVLIGYPKAKGIETATRTLSPEAVICDELGGIDETRAILSAQNTGVPLIASAHAGSLSELLMRPNIRLLHDEGVFSYYVGASRKRAGERLSRCFSFKYTPRAQIESEAKHQKVQEM